MRCSWYRRVSFNKIGNYWKNFKVSIGEKKFYILVNKETGKWYYFKEDEFEKIKRKGFDREHFENVNEYVYRYPPQTFPSALILNITTHCNFACRYCFASGAKPKVMKKDVIQRAIEELMKTPYKSIRIEFQGGEPLLNKEGIIFAVEYAKEINPGKKIYFGMETNGSLLDEDFARFLKKNNFSIGFSIDGPKELHDKVRVYKNNSGTFDDVMNGLENAKRVGFTKNEIGNVCVITKANVNFPERLADFFNDININYKTVPVNPMGMAKINKDILITNDEWYNFLVRTYNYLKNNNLKTRNMMIDVLEMNVYSPERTYICLRSPCGMAHEIVSINPNGDVYPCDGFKGTEEFKLGNITKGSLGNIILKEKYRKLANRSWKNIEKCKRCYFSGFCGPCAYASFGLYGSIYREDPYCLARTKFFIFLIKEFIKREEDIND